MFLGTLLVSVLERIFNLNTHSKVDKDVKKLVGKVSMFRFVQKSDVTL